MYWKLTGGEPLISKIVAQDIREIYKGRKFVYELLISLLAKEPCEQSLKYLCDKDEVNGLLEIFSGARIIVESIRAANISNLADFVQSNRTEYQRLFVGPTPIQVPIWESVYFDKDMLLFGERTMKVRNFYNKYDLEFIHKNKEPEDHMAVELEFVLFLINKSLEAKSEMKMMELTKDQLMFLTEHINTWNEKFADLILDLTDSTLFQGVALLLKEFIEFDIEILNIITSNANPYENISIKSFVKWSKSLDSSSFNFNHSQLIKTNYNNNHTEEYTNEEKIVPTCSNFDCGGKCMVKAHIKDGVITKISTRSNEELNESSPMIKACARGINYRKYQYHLNRLKYPMKRVGKRGEGKFERISWEEAIDTIVYETQRITEKYGPNSRYIHAGTGTTGGIMPSESLAGRLFSLTGGYLSYYHSVSMGNTAAATSYTYGTSNTGNSLDSLADTKLVILWGHNPSVTIFGNTNYYFRKMKEKGCKFIVVDPRYSDTAVTYGDQWIPLLPTTDNALMDAMSYVIIKENLYDKDFVDKFCLGFNEENMPLGVPAKESVVSYLFGKKDGITKNPRMGRTYMQSSSGYNKKPC